MREECDLLRRTILAITTFRRLTSILVNFSSPQYQITNFQKLSTHCMRKYLSNYLNGIFLYAYEFLRDRLTEQFENLLEQTRFLVSSAVPELCVYCNDIIEEDRLTCADNHEMARCCVSMVQVIDY